MGSIKSVQTSVEDLGASDPIVRSAADASALGMAFVLETRPDGSRRFIFAGPRCLHVNGVSGADAMADAARVFDLMPPEHRAAFAAAEAQAAETLSPFDIEVAMRRPDGEPRWHRFASLPRAQPDGAIIWDGLQIDVTERRRMAAELVEQRRRVEVAVEATALGLWEWEVASDRLVWSDRNRALFGLSPGEPVSMRRYFQLVHPDDVQRVRDSFAEARDKPHGGDYSVEHRIITPAGETRWIQAHGRISKDADGAPALVVGTSLDITARRATEDRRNLLMGELAHRAKNGIAVLMAIVSQTARNADSVQQLEAQIMSRLQAMAASQDLVTASGGAPVPLTDIFAKALEPFGRTRVDVSPALSAVVLRGDMAPGMGLLLHEMATNAVKYGALSASKGRVLIEPDASPGGRAAFAWREVGGPPVKAVVNPGFGTRLLQQVLRPQGGEVAFAFDPAGFNARVEFPASATDR